MSLSQRQGMAGKYRLLDRIGEGGVAEVFEAVHEEIGQRVAIKILKRELMQRTNAAMRFLTEARIAGVVGHPGIVQIFDYGHLDTGEPYLVMELLQGEDLFVVLQRVKRFELEHAVGLMFHVLDALAAAHRAGVVHRDMKPENVILTRGPGNEPWAKIIDFGIARVISADAMPARLTAMGILLGTPHYLSPEQARGERDIDARTDVYAVGVMLFELLTGKPPFDGGSGPEVVGRVLTDPFPSPRLLCPSIPAELEQVIFKATARRREDRYASAAEFMDALRPFKGESAAVPPSGLRGSSSDPDSSTPLPDSFQVVSSPPPAPSGSGVEKAGPDGVGMDAALPRQVHPLRTWGAVAATALGLAMLVAAVTERSLASAPAAGSAAAVVDPSDAGVLVVRSEAPQRSGAATVHDATTIGKVVSADAAAALPEAGAAVGTLRAARTPAPPAKIERGALVDGSAVREQALVKLVGLPPGTQALVDGQPVEAVFPMEVSDETHTLRVVGRGWKVYVREFQVRGELAIPVRLESTEAAAPGRRPDAGPASRAGRDAGLRDPLGNPFGGV